MSIESLEHMVRNRVRLFLRHTWLVAILGTLILASAVWAGFYFTAEEDTLRIAAGPAGSPDAKFAQVLSDELKKQHRKVYLKPLPTLGDKSTVQAMTDGRANLAIIPSSSNDTLHWPAVAILRHNVAVLIVPAPSAMAAKKPKGVKPVKLEKVPDLSGHRVGIVTGTEATADLLNLVLNHYGVSLAKVQASEIDPQNLAAAIKNNQVDAVFVAGAATGADIANAVAAASANGSAPTFIPIDQAEGIANRNPAYASQDIDAGTFGGKPPSPDDSLTTLRFDEYLVANKSINSNIIGTLARAIYTSRQSLDAAMGGEVKIAAPSTDKDGDVVVHPGALAYLGDTQQSFFDKYGDEIFYGMLIFPVFGSAIAGVASYLRRDTRTRRLRLLQRVLDLVRKTHAAQTLEAIDQLQVDADNLVIAIIHQGEHEEFDETVRMSFAFALDQLRFAIAGQRAAILDRAGRNSASGGGSSKAAAA
jgi:TRAP transporter TAXI family solute receptor